MEIIRWRAELATELQTQMNAVLEPTCTVSFDSNTGKLTFSTGDSSDFQIVADTKNYRYLGFDKSSANSSSTTQILERRFCFTAQMN